MLRPQATATREVISLDEIWNFELSDSTDIQSDLPPDRSWVEHLKPDLQCPVPASYNDIFADQNIREHVGWVRYQRMVYIPQVWKNKRICLHFDAAQHHARVYVNDRLVTEHRGGYTPFEADITRLIEPGDQFRLTVAVSNILTWETIPPGYIEVQGEGKRKQHHQQDFFNYAGLARSVSLVSTPKAYISDITVTTDVVNGSIGVINYDVTITNPTQSGKCSVTLIDEEEDTAGHAFGTKNRIQVDNAHLWQPGIAYLYRLEVSLEEYNVAKDVYNLPVGIRSVRVDGNRFLINNKPFYFTGIGRHEDTPVRGRGFDPAYMVRDFRLMKWFDANSLRTAHFPYAEEVLEYADRHGIVVIDETAAGGLNLNTNMDVGVSGSKSTPTFSPDAISNKTQASHSRAIRELVQRDKNHPSVCLWCIANEPASSEAGAREYFQPLVNLARDLDSTRPVCFTNMGLATVDTDVIADLFDVLCLNWHCDRATQTGDLASIETALEADLRGWEAKHNKPIIMTKYGADTAMDLHSTHNDNQSQNEESQSKTLEIFHRVFDRLDNVVGEYVWSFKDFRYPPAIGQGDGNERGGFNRDLRQEEAAQVLKARWSQQR
ncbi:glycosyl hydrolases family 2, TIM barrel domain-containing protein [Dendryphion nanum]|uniref:Beta-glucuronidase n=1 Tax=Dendryphion nanum TaxID=256645 RepID=A0A9P9E013_9PLEO|nr:glycosyl hydrolases family 2, TIM barrel domain-containing protein [Dendryphion nanum]